MSGENGAPPSGSAANPRIAAGRVTWTATVHSLTMYAFNLPAWRIRGLQDEPHYVSIAGTTNGTASVDDVRTMLRHLLGDRFKLATHTVSEERSSYALVVAKNGPRLQRAAEDGTPPPMPAYMASYSPGPYEGFIFESYVAEDIAAITGRRVPVSRLAEALSSHLRMFVLDRTGLSGPFYFGFRFQPIDQVNADPSRAPSVFTALEEELGLKLEGLRAPVEFLVVDHVEKTPTSD